MLELFNSIVNERNRQIAKFGEQLDTSDLENLSILIEEVGEVAQIVTKRNVKPIKESDLQDYNLEMLKEEFATVCIAWIDKINKRKN